MMPHYKLGEPVETSLSTDQADEERETGSRFYRAPPPRAISRGSTSGQTLVIARADGTIEVWNLARRERLLTLQSPPQELPEGDGLAVDEAKQIFGATVAEGGALWRFDGTLVRRFEGNPELRLTKQGMLLTRTAAAFTLTDPFSGRVEARLDLDQPDLGVVTDHALDTSETRLLITHGSGLTALSRTRIWEIGGQARDIFEGPSYERPSPTRVAFLPQGDRIVLVDQHDLLLIDVATGEQTRGALYEDLEALLLRLDLARGKYEPTHHTEVMSVSPDGRWIAIGGRMSASEYEQRGTLWLWDIEAGSCKHLNVCRSEDAASAVTQVCFTHDGQLIAHRGRTLEIWNAASGAPLAFLEGTQGHGGGYGGYTGFSVIGSQVFAYATDSVIYGWDLEAFRTV